MRTIVSLMRFVGAILVMFIFGSAISFGTGVDLWIPVSVLGVVTFVPTGLGANCLAVLVGTHTGAIAYAESIESPVARIMIDADSTTALATVTAVKMSLTQSTKRKTGTLFPELSFAILADIAGFIDAIYYEMTATFRIIFSIPISLGGAYDTEGGSLSYVLSNCTAADMIKVYAIDDAKRELDYIEITPMSCPAGGSKTIDVTQCPFFFMDPTNITRLKINYRNSVSIEYLGEEIKEIARLVNPVHKVTDVGILTAGYSGIAGINITDASTVEVTATVLGLCYVVKHLLAA